MMRERIAKLEVDARLNAAKIAERREILDWAIGEKRKLAALNEDKASSLGQSASTPNLSGQDRMRGTQMNHSGVADLGGGTRPSASGKLFTGTKDGKNLLGRIQMAGTVASRNADEMAHRRGVLDIAKRDHHGSASSGHGSSSFNHSSAVASASSFGGAMQQHVSMPSLTNTGGSSFETFGPGFAGDDWTTLERRRKPNQTYLDIIDGARGQGDSFKLEWSETLSKDIPPSLISPTAPMKERFDHFEKLAMWNAHRMSHHRKQLVDLRKY